MNISIWDLDWFQHTSNIPNVQCMKLSSYSKQLGYSVNFIETKEHLMLPFDKIFIFKEKESTMLPSQQWLENPKTVLIGTKFKYFKSHKLSAVIMACRPDYLLYPINMKNPYQSANFVTFFCGTKRIEKMQDFHNTLKNGNKTIVADAELWKTTKDDIKWCLNNLRKEKNIVFLYPISLKILLEDAEIKSLFLSLHFSRGTIFKWDMTGEDTIEQFTEVINFIDSLRQHTSSDIGKIRIIQRHNTDEEYINILEKIRLCKEKKMFCRVITQKNCDDKFKLLQKWMDKSPELSYVEFILHPHCYSRKETWTEILNNPSQWSDKNILLLIQSLISDRYFSIVRDFFLQWGDRWLGDKNINYETLKSSLSLLYKEFKNE